MQVTVAQLQACFLDLPRIKPERTDRIIFIVMLEEQPDGEHVFPSIWTDNEQDPDALIEAGMLFTTLAFDWSEDLKTWTTDL